MQHNGASAQGSFDEEAEGETTVDITVNQAATAGSRSRIFLHLWVNECYLPTWIFRGWRKSSQRGRSAPPRLSLGDIRVRRDAAPHVAGDFRCIRVFLTCKLYPSGWYCTENSTEFLHSACSQHDLRLNCMVPLFSTQSLGNPKFVLKKIRKVLCFVEMRLPA